MEFPRPLIKGKLIKRYKLFFTDIKIKNKVITAHCPNTGSMKGLLEKVMMSICFQTIILKENLNMVWRLLNLEKT